MIALFKSPKTIMVLLVVGLAGAGLWKGSNLISDYAAAQKMITQLQAQKEILESNLEVAEQARLQAERAFAIAEEAHAEALIRLRSYNFIEDEIDNATNDEDAPVSPVLRRALDAIDGLR